MLVFFHLVSFTNIQSVIGLIEINPNFKNFLNCKSRVMCVRCMMMVLSVFGARRVCELTLSASADHVCDWLVLEFMSNYFLILIETKFTF